MIDELILHRRKLHTIPEIACDLPLTCQYVKEVLSKYDCHVFSPIESSVCAYFDCNKKDTIAFRADMDALPILENTNLEFASKHEGKMHGCGHDGHTAMVLTLAGIINTQKDKLSHNVMLIFQPGEESEGGAEKICLSGIFEKYNIIRVFGCHIWPDLPTGAIGARPVEMMAKCSEIDVNIQGVSSHIAKSELGKDAMVAGAEFLLKTYDMVENEIPPKTFRLLKFGKMISGTVGNAISAHTFMKGSLRAFDMDTFNFMKRRMNEIGQQITEKTGCQFDIEVAAGYPPLLNDVDLFEKVYKKYKDDITYIETPSMTGEDFSFYSQKAPVFFFFLGVGVDTPLHSDKFNFDEKNLVKGVEFYKKLLYLD